MVLFAGPIVIEWYWIPILFLLMVGPPVLVIGLVSEVILRAPRSGPRTWLKRRRVWAAVAAGWLLLMLAGDVVMPGP